MKETHKRTIVKTLSFRFIATLTTMIIVYAFTKSLALAGTVGILDTILKLFIYYFHERAWGKTRWGLKEN